ncbi:MAG: hypothetical protein ACFCUX_07945 [Candidatus Methylacidiphilales bacterium]
MINLIEIIRTECISERHCMLTLYNEQSDCGFLYFKEAQLIEVNAGKQWGKDALGTIVSWTISSYNISELPRGIKRTIWEPLDQIFSELVDWESGYSLGQAIGQLQMENLEERAGEAPALRDPLAPIARKLEDIPGFLAVFKQQGDEIRPLSGEMPSRSLSTDWFEQFTTRALDLGTGLGAGDLKEWFMEVEDYRVWYVTLNDTPLLIFSNTDGMIEDFEQQFRDALV